MKDPYSPFRRSHTLVFSSERPISIIPQKGFRKFRIFHLQNALFYLKLITWHLLRLKVVDPKNISKLSLAKERNPDGALCFLQYIGILIHRTLVKSDSILGYTMRTFPVNSSQHLWRTSKLEYLF